MFLAQPELITCGMPAVRLAAQQGVASKLDRAAMHAPHHHNHRTVIKIFLSFTYVFVFADNGRVCTLFFVAAAAAMYDRTRF